MKQQLKNKLAIAACELYTRETGLEASSGKGFITLKDDQGKKIITSVLTKQVQNIIFKAIQLQQRLNTKIKDGADQ